MSSRQNAPASLTLFGAAVFGALAQFLPTTALAEVNIAGPADAVRIEARDATVNEVMVALGAAFGLHYSTNKALDQRVTANYQGPLPQVIARVLAGYDYVVKNNAADGVEVVVYGTAGSTPVPAVANGPSSEEIAAATRNATAQLQSLWQALDNLPK